MFTLKNTILGEVIDVIHSARTNRVYLVLDGAFTSDNPHYLVPLLCPACGEPWHFVSNDSPEQMVEALKNALEGYQLVEVKYYPRSSAKNIAAAMETLSTGSEVAELLFENVADHLGEGATFPVIGLVFEMHVPSTTSSSEELRAMDPDEVRELLDLDDKEEVDTAIQQLADWMDSDGFEDYDVEDEFLLVVHPSAILETIVVEPEPAPEDEEDIDFGDEDEEGEDEGEYSELNVIYPYELMLRLVEEANAAAAEDELTSDS